MCRIFAFRSVIPSQVHRSLLDAENALGVLSNDHPDGWGVAFYIDGAPHVMRSPTTALGDRLFHQLSGVVSSQTVLAHVRKATHGELSVLNCHPFQYGRWLFCHNGDIPNFAEHGEALREQIAPALRRFVLGGTDSEVIFFIVLTQLAQQKALSASYTAHDVLAAVRRGCEIVRELCDTADSRALLTMVITNGETMIAHQGGKELYRSTHKTRCGERERCPSLSPECEAPSLSGWTNHLVLSSEPLEGENVWEAMAEGELVGVDSHMRLLGTSARDLGALAMDDSRVRLPVT